MKLTISLAIFLLLFICIACIEVTSKTENSVYFNDIADTPITADTTEDCVAMDFHFLITENVLYSSKVRHIVTSENRIVQDANNTDIRIESKNTNSVKNNIDVASLCNKLHELKQMPYDPSEQSDDFIYSGLMKKGNEAIPCLIEKITDTTLMDDPRQAPHIQNFRVGDAAVFMLLYITKEDWQPETMLSPEYAKNWKSDGIYAYFAYVEKRENRKKLQQWWKNWMKRAEIRN